MDPKTAEYMKTYCLMVKSRRAARSITRRYNKLARTYDLQATQIGLLFAISAGGFDSISELAEQFIPVWFEAHDKVRAELGEEKWNQVQDALKILAELE